MFKIFRSLFFLLLFAGTTILRVDAQKTEAETEFKYLKNSDNSRTLTYSVKYKKDDGDLKPAEGIPVLFKSGDHDVLATVATDYKGIATYNIPADRNLAFENDNKLKFTATIVNNNLVENKSDELSMKDIEIQMDFQIVDSVKKIFFKAFEIGAKGERKPIAKTDINFYVPRMFSLLKITDGSFGEDGTGEIEFPSGIPGDSLGNITVIGRIEENADYANVEKRQVIAWGKATDYHIPRFQRALWTAVAPTWMIITLTILLFGVWAHYAFVVYKLWKIKQESRRDM